MYDDLSKLISLPRVQTLHTILRNESDDKLFSVMYELRFVLGVLES
jgi:hypothetical protein